MRINNKRVGVYIETLYTLLFIGLLCSFLLILIPVSKIVEIISPYYLVLIFLGLIVLAYRYGHQLFDYNSDGEVLNIKTQDAFWAKHFPQTRKLTDFPKNKLRDFKIKKGLFNRKLDLFVSSKRSKKGYVKLTFNITFLSRSEVADLRLSLSRMVKRNRENKQEELE